MTSHLCPSATLLTLASEIRQSKRVSLQRVFLNFARGLTALVAATVALYALPALAQIDATTSARIDRILKATPLIDGHNDIAEQLSDYHGSRVEKLASSTAEWSDHPSSFPAGTTGRRPTRL